MIYGIGNDILDIGRIAALLHKHPHSLPRRILSRSEWEGFSGSRDPARFLAKRFAAKEAFAKAVGTGIRAPVVFGSISIIHDELGRPGFACGSSLTHWLQERGIRRVHLSLSDERAQVAAFAVAECG